MEKECQPKTWITREAIQLPPGNSNKWWVNKEIVNAEKDTLRPNPHTSLVLLASVLAALEPVCRPLRKRAAAVAVPLPLSVTFDMAAMP